MQTTDYEIVSLGVDWITGTTKDRDATERLLTFGSNSITVEMQRGNDRSGWGMAGFRGHKCGGVQVGFREDEGIVRLSSHYALDHWMRLYELSDNISRLDLQVTSRTSVGPSKRVHADWKRAKRQSAKRAKGAEVTIISKMRGGDTFYTGSPSSRVFGRCYDKAAQSKLPYFAGCVRHEVQYNGKLALLVARNLYNAKPFASTLPGHVSRFWRSRLGRFNVLEDPGQRILPSRAFTDDDSRLVWFRKSVRPSVEKLIAHGRIVDVLEALGLSDEVRS